MLQLTWVGLVRPWLCVGQMRRRSDASNCVTFRLVSQQAKELERGRHYRQPFLENRKKKIQVA
jgi:hypothetical protein